MYLYDEISNIVHIPENLKAECGITEESKSHCFFVDSIDNVDKQGLWSKHFVKPTRCPYCFKKSNK